ncbi:adenylyltransferase/cytidyltransferase family protein [Clostridium sulfidigenes]|uniref:adenylyltransferase/cytidyltransferase family protein n=1 Tax=Clostridium sulfidigenes TaxID=318464 RepID=UPI003F89D8A5
MKKYKIGYTTGVFDMFHIGHLNILKRAKEECEFLIVGVTTDELVAYKNKKAVIPHNERMAIVESIKYVDKVVSQENMDKMKAWKKYNFDVMFVGSDWKGTAKWNEFEKQFNAVGVDIVYFSYTQGTSSTQLREVLQKILNSDVAITK